MKYFKQDFRFWFLGLVVSVFSLFYIKFDSGSIQPDYLAKTARSILDETEQNESFKITDTDLVKRVSRALFHILLREE